MRRTQTKRARALLFTLPPSLAAVALWRLLDIDLWDFPVGFLEGLGLVIGVGAVWGGLVRFAQWLLGLRSRPGDSPTEQR